MSNTLESTSIQVLCKAKVVIPRLLQQFGDDKFDCTLQNKVVSIIIKWNQDQFDYYKKHIDKHGYVDVPVECYDKTIDSVIDDIRLFNQVASYDRSEHIFTRLLVKYDNVCMIDIDLV